VWGVHTDGVRTPFSRVVAVKAGRVRADLAFAAVDVFVVTGGYMIALAIRMIDPDVSDRYWSDLIGILPMLVVLHLAGNVVAGAYGHVWEHASIAEARQILISNIAVLLGVGMFVLMQDDRPIPLSTIVLGGTFTAAGMGLVRFRSRMFSYRRLTSTGRRPTALVVGTNRAAATFAREAGASVEVVGFISAEPTRDHRWLAGVPILGSLDDLVPTISSHGVEQVVVAGGTDELARSVVDACTTVDVRLRILPDPATLMEDSHAAVDARDIEITDLLPRAEVSTDLLAVRTVLEGKRILVTGAGGSIGSEVVRQVLDFSPRQVIALDHDETLLHEMILSLGAGSFPVMPILIDVRDGRRMRERISELAPEVVFHAAALKHVPVLETHPDEAHKTNVMGTVHLLEALREVPIERFVLISTDKAVRPASVMGASKRVAEMVVQQESLRYGAGVYTSVRFGNVLGSRGSVVPTFVRQIQSGGPVTITDEKMSRYFMTVNEAVQLVLQAAALAKGGEVFVLDMGEQVKILDLARRMIRLAGLVPGRDIDVAFTGIRPGERLEESLAHGDLLPTEHPQLRVTWPPSPGPVTMWDFVTLLDELAQSGDRLGVQEGLRDLATQEWDGFEVVKLDLEDTVSPWI
jgi:FlaA1/EpsC-like NDP-sugar epimerase